MTDQATAGAATTTAGGGADASAATTDDKGTATIVGGEPAKPDEAKPGDDAAKAAAEKEAADKAAEKAAADAEAAKKAGAPEKYEFKAPEGITFEPEVQTKFEALARDANLPQEKAQAFLDMAADHVKSLVKQQSDDFSAQVERWATDTKADPEIGGKAYDQTVQHAQAAVRAIGNPKLQQVLNETGLGNHPEIVRAFAKVGRALSDGKLISGSSVDGATKPLADRLYPTMVGNQGS